MKKEINCESCLMPIKAREELRTVWAFFKLRPYHRSCYENSLKGAALFVGNQPVNGFPGNFTALAAFVLAWTPLFTDITPALSIVGSLIVLLRLYSFLRFEKQLPQ
ncbi:hypothetical protein AWM68_11750 [Fictibacillus phosphorivorans]|uniref:Permease n=1 Tax=Fictibacillus phosphorivorans TaxID=1221500 RepID=A0A165RVS5_9BACL|nr:hypothetical protein [Fictibacillus phosphorivorans]KZE63782.1 hypothetical protein AWM68_11750 [Fictibacillus phosphorivorans]